MPLTAAAESSPNMSPQKDAAAFLALGYEKPFGHRKFQEVWLRRFAGRNGEWLTAVMEDTIRHNSLRLSGTWKRWMWRIS